MVWLLAVALLSRAELPKASHRSALTVCHSSPPPPHLAPHTAPYPLSLPYNKHPLHCFSSLPSVNTSATTSRPARGWGVRLTERTRMPRSVGEGRVAPHVAHKVRRQVGCRRGDDAGVVGDTHARPGLKHGTRRVELLSSSSSSSFGRAIGWGREQHLSQPP